MKIVFLLIIVIAGSDQDSDPRLLFADAFDCNRFALYTERQAVSASRMNKGTQTDVTAYCVPRVVPQNTMVIPSSRAETR